MSELLAQDLKERARIALAEARHRRLAFAALPVGIGDPPWELLLCLCAHDDDDGSLSAVPDLAESTGLSELVIRRHLAVLCEAGLAWVQLDPATGVAEVTGLTEDGRCRIADVLTGTPG